MSYRTSFHQRHKPEFENLVLRAKEYIEAGEVFQVVVSRRLEADFDRRSIFTLPETKKTKSFTVYVLYGLRRSYCRRRFAGKPRLCVRWKSDDKSNCGNAKTWQRQSRRCALEKELLADPKELAEHEMLVELGESGHEESMCPWVGPSNKAYGSRSLRTCHAYRV